MAEEKAEEKGFYLFGVERDQERRKELSSLKNKYKFDQLLELMGLKVRSADGKLDWLKEEPADGATLQKRLQDEASAIKSALAEDRGKVAEYAREEAGKKEKGRLDGTAGFPDLNADFAVVDDYEKKYLDTYNAYLSEDAELAAPKNTAAENRDQAQKALEEARDLLDKATTDEARDAARDRLDISEREYDRLAAIYNAENKKYNGASERLKNTYAKAIEEHEKSEESQRNIKEVLYDEIEPLSTVPSETLQRLIEFKQECESQGCSDKFDEAYEKFFASSKFGPKYVMDNSNPKNVHIKKDENGRNIIINEHRFALDSQKRVIHSICNLNNTGLDVSWVGDKFGLAHSPEKMTGAQVRALAEYCHYNGISISNYGKLENLKVIDDNGQQVGTAPECMEKEFLRLKNGGEELPEGKVNGARDSGTNGGDFGQFLRSTPALNVSRSKMMEAFESRLNLMKGGVFSAKTEGLGSTLINVWFSENDKIDDNKIDEKGHKKHTKRFSVRFVYEVPPTAQMYIGEREEFTTDHARLMLDAFKAVGCEYFIIPPANKSGGNGKGMQGAFMEASVKTGLVPFLKGSPNGEGCDIGQADLETIFKKIPEEPSFKNSATAKAEYMMRWHQQLQKYVNSDPKKAEKRSNDLGDYMSQFAYQARFATFQSSHILRLDKYISECKMGEHAWDVADMASANLALTKVLQEIGEGRLSGKPYNPLNNSYDQIQSVFDQYRQEFRTKGGQLYNDKGELENIPSVESRIQKEYDKTNRTDKNDPNKVKTSANTICSVCQSRLNTELKKLKGYGVEMNIEIKGGVSYEMPDRSNTQTNFNAPDTKFTGRTVKLPDKGNGR